MSKINAASMDEVVKFIRNHDLTKIGSWKKDDKGQLVFFSEIYEWSDGTFHDKPESP